MVEFIQSGSVILAIIVRAQYRREGVEFFTPLSFSQQLGYMNRPKGYVVVPHKHLPQSREVLNTQEVLFVRSGKIRADFYTENNDYHSSALLLPHDVILLAAGGHGFEMLEDSELIEVKQGPYNEKTDKLHFQ